MIEKISILLFTFLFFLLFGWWLFYLPLNTKKIKKIEEKFYKKLLTVCKKEQIYINFYDNIYELNEIKEEEYKLKNLSTGKLAVGRYVHLKPHYDSPLNRVNYKLPEIKLIKEENNVWTFAHELGHHFCVKNNDDDSEKGANRYIKTLAKQHLNIYERNCLRIHISVYFNR